MNNETLYIIKGADDGQVLGWTTSEMDFKDWFKGDVGSSADIVGEKEYDMVGGNSIVMYLVEFNLPFC